MTIRDEILEAIPPLLARTGLDDFSPQEIVDELRRRGSNYTESGIRAHVVSRMCATAPDHHARESDDLEKVAPGRYRIRRTWAYR